MLQDSIARIDVHGDHLAIRLKSADGEETSDSTDDQLLSIPWQKPPSRRSRQILLPHGIPRNEVRPTGSSVAHVSSARSPGAVAGLTKSFLAP